MVGYKTFDIQNHKEMESNKDDLNILRTIILPNSLITLFDEMAHRYLSKSLESCGELSGNQCITFIEEEIFN